MHVFTYGTLMFPEVWRAVVGCAFATARATLHGFAIYRVRHAVYPGIVAASPRDAVRGVLHLDVDGAALRRLDRFEGELYRRQSVPVRCDDGRERIAETFVVPLEARARLTGQPWRPEEFVARGDLDRFLAEYQGFARVVEEDER